jgi:hypothetical protein
MSFYADLPPPSSGVDPGTTSASSGWNASQKQLALPQRKPVKPPPLPRALASAKRQAPPPPIPTTSSTGPAPVMVNTAGLKPPPQRPSQSAGTKLSTGTYTITRHELDSSVLRFRICNQYSYSYCYCIAQLASLSDSSTAALSAILATLPGTSGTEVNLLDDDSIQNKYNPVRYYLALLASCVTFQSSSFHCSSIFWYHSCGS